MTIVRAPRLERNFTIISNSVCLDPRLSMRALGMLVRLLCRPDDWHTNSETLAREFDCGRDQVRAVLRELAEAGYMQLRKEQGIGGKFSSKWYVFDAPHQPEPEKPEAGKPAPGNPYVGGSGSIPRTDLPRTDTNPLTPKGEESPTGFAKFWETYPKKVGKDAAVSAWKRKVKAPETIGAVLTAVDQQKRSDEWKKEEGKFVPNPATWLNQGRWKDEAPKTGSSAFAGVI